VQSLLRGSAAPHLGTADPHHQTGGGVLFPHDPKHEAKAFAKISEEVKAVMARRDKIVEQFKKLISERVRTKYSLLTSLLSAVPRSTLAFAQEAPSHDKAAGGTVKGMS
jgi:hypothetical protein